MIFRQLQDKNSSTYTYLLATPEKRQAVLIDPVFDQLENYLQLLHQLEINLVAAFDTHIHADHITASGILRQECQSEIIMDANSKAQGVTIGLKDNEQITIAGFCFTSLHTPGHTDDSACFLLEDRVFTGDTLLINGSGRTDFQNGSAAQSYESITKKILTLRAETLVYPAHDYNHRMVSTIGEERHFNPRLKGNDKEAYIHIMNGLNLPHPKMLELAVPANLHCGLT